ELASIRGSITRASGAPRSASGTRALLALHAPTIAIAAAPRQTICMASANYPRGARATTEKGGLRPDAALVIAVLQLLEADRVRRRAPVGLVRCRVLPHALVRLLHAALEALLHLLERPLLAA